MVCCNQSEFETFKKTFHFDNIEMCISIHKCLCCGKEYIDESIPEEVKKLIIDFQVKEKRKEVFHFLKEHELTCSLKEIRQKKGLTQPEVALRAGVKPQRISAIENNALNVKIETAFRLAKALECKVTDIWYYKNKEDIKKKDIKILKENKRN